jgi:hypothetical protein
MVHSICICTHQRAGSLSKIVEQTAAQLAKDCPGDAQVGGVGG